MAKLGKIFLYAVAGIVGVVVIAAIAFVMFFDPNDFRDTLSAQVEAATGRELAIEGDLSVSFFPWLAVEVGRTTLGNAAGFGDDPFVSFDSARLSVKVMPLLTRQEVAVGTAALDGFEANLAIAADGTTNWEDLASGDDTPAAADSADTGSVALDIANVALNDARINYTDAQSGSAYELTNVNLNTGRIAAGETFPVDGGFDFAAQPNDVSGGLSIAANVTLSDDMLRVATEGLNIEGSLSGLVSTPTDFRLASRAITLDSEQQQVSLGEIDLSVLGLSMSANVEPYAYAGTSDLRAALTVAEFSLKELMRTLDIEPPPTADPNALERLSFEANAVVGQEALTLSSLNLVMDDTTLSGDLSVPLTSAGALVFDLAADSITLDNYMAPADETAVDAEEPAADVEIPADLIRTLKAEGSVRLREAFLGPVTFSNLELGVNGSGGRLRLHPINAEFFDGSYQGDVNIDASDSLPTLSLNERIADVDLAAMALALYEADNITGTINGSFVLEGSGATLSAITSDLDGSMAFELLDGAWEGTDVWHQIRSARAIYKREPPPEPRNPPRTEFSTVTATGAVTDGVFRNEDLLAEMPFMRVTGEGSIDLTVREIDYSVQARVLEKPEFMGDVSEEELKDYTQALIPIRIRGPLADPSFRPDIEAMFRAEVEAAIDEKKDELKEDLLNKLLGGDEDEGAAGEGADTEEEPRDVEDELKDRLKDLFPR